MKKNYILFLCLAAFITVSAQEIVPIAVDSIAIKADKFFGFDGYKNFYYCNNNIIIKKNKNSNLQFQDLSLGDVTKVDILNPLKIIVFYEKFNTVVILDNQMNEMERIHFSEFENPIIATSVGVADQNKLWIFNALNQKITLFDLVSKNYQTIGNSLDGEVNYYQTDYNYFQWISKNGRLNTCDRYGKILEVAQLNFAEAYQIISPNEILFIKDNALFVRDFSANKQTKIQIVEKSFRNFYYKDQILSIFTNEGNTNYKINLP
jgi:hypothetical protein